MAKKDRSPTYRREALAHYPSQCVWCGFAIRDVLEVAHLDGNRRNNALSNLAVLCPTHHRRLDLDLLPEDAVRQLRDHPRKPRWSKLQGDGPARAAATLRAKRARHRAAAAKAVATRQLRQGKASAGSV